MKNHILSAGGVYVMTDSTSSKSVATFEGLLSTYGSALTLKRPMLDGAGSVSGLFMLAGYYVGRMLTTLFDVMGANPINKTTIIAAAFGGIVFALDEFVFGPYSKPCENGRTKACGCHAGLREVHLAYFDPPLTLHRIPEATLDLSMDVCVPVGVGIQSPLIQLVAAPTNSTLLPLDVRALSADATAQFIAGDRAGYINISTSPSSRTGILMKRNYSTMDDLVAIHANRITTVSMGSVYAQDVDAFSDQVTVALDPLYTVPLLHSGRFVERVVHFTPTLQQEVHALSAHYAPIGGFRVLTTVADDAVFARELSDACRRSSHTFGHAYGGRVDAVSSIASALPTIAGGGGAVMVHGLQTHADIAAVNAFLAAHPTAVVIIPFHHLALWYEVIVSIIAEPSHRQRVVFATSLPSWNPASMHTTSHTSTLMKSYYAAMIAQGLPYTPQTLRGYLTQRVVANIVERIPSALTQTSFLSTLYSVSIIVLDSAYSVGPLSNAACGPNGGQQVGMDCENNIGARHVWVRTLNSVTASDPIVAAQQVVGELAFASGVIDYRSLPDGEGLGTLAIVLIVVGVVLALLTLCAVLLRAFGGRSHANAPKDAEKVFTIVFTDIQSSTSLWAEIPEEMGQALDTHHVIIRSLISRHRGYEVKTIGDAFMIAFKSADDAVTFAFALQYALYECEDFSPMLDQAYLSFDRERQAADKLPVCNLSCDLPSEAYAAQWRGLRVRAGIHTDFGTIQKDPVTKAYDYYGTVANTAARVEAVCHGGQVCFTEGTLSSLARLQLDISTNDGALSPALYLRVGKAFGPLYALRMGEKELRGLARSVMLYQLECMAGRLFPPLRLEMGADADSFDYDDDGEDDVTGTGTTGNPSSQPLGSDARNFDSQQKNHPHNAVIHISSDSQSIGSSARQWRGGRTFAPEVSSLNVMITLFTLFSRIPQPERRLKELHKMCDLWDVKVSKKAVERAKLWGSLSPSTEMNSNRMMAIHLSKEDASAAAHVEVLSRRIRNIATKNLQNTVVMTHGAGAPMNPMRHNHHHNNGCGLLRDDGTPSNQAVGGGAAGGGGTFGQLSMPYPSSSGPLGPGNDNGRTPRMHHSVSSTLASPISRAVAVHATGNRAFHHGSHHNALSPPELSLLPTLGSTSNSLIGQLEANNH